MCALEIIYYFYPEDTPLRKLLLKHSMQVRDKALEILGNPTCRTLKLNREIVEDGAMLHDIGIFRCNAPGILCEGTEPYLAHGIIGAALLREFGKTRKIDLEVFARICERHTGTGITASEIREQNLPLPERDFLPETLEEKLICLADKFYSKSGNMLEKSPEKIRKSMKKFAPDTLERFEQMCCTFGLN